MCMCLFVAAGSPERRQLSFSVTQSVKKSPYGREALSAHDSIAPGQYRWINTINFLLIHLIFVEAYIVYAVRLV